VNRFAALLSLLFMCQAASADKEKINGTWLTGDGDGWVDIALTDSGLSGVIAGTPNDRPDRSRFDDKNPDPELRGRALMGLVIMSGFNRSGTNNWKGGRIYDPNSGKTYRCSITLVDDSTLKLRGYIGISLLGRTDTWTRYQE
jgi:uncharacterized protein (DUF2147 family)